MTEERRIVEIQSWEIATILALIIIIAGLWFLPSFVHLRQDYEVYFEIIDIAPVNSTKDFVERGFVIYGPWQTDVRITGNYVVHDYLSAQIYVLDSLNYNFFQSGLLYQDLYVSEVRTAQAFSIPIPAGNGQETTWYLVFKNPNSQSIFITSRAGVSYERAFLGHSYVEWISRIGIVIALTYAVWAIISKRYVIRLVPEPKSRKNFDTNNV